MEEDQEKQEDKIDIFTREGESLGYISLDQARVLAIQHARDNPEFYGDRYSGVNFVWEVLSQEEGDDYYDIRLSFRPAGRFRGEPGIEQFTMDKLGNIEIRQLLDEPSGMDLPEEQPASSGPQAVTVPPDQTSPDPVAARTTPPSQTPPARMQQVATPSEGDPAIPPEETASDRPWRKRLVIGGSAVVAVFVLLFIIGIITDEEQTPESTPAPVATAAPEVIFETAATSAPAMFATAVPVATPTVAPKVANTEPSGALRVATSNFSNVEGTPQFCGPGCPETLYLLGVTETLTGVEAGPGGPLDPQSIPMLAESWEIPEDLSYIRFQIRAGVQFHNGWGEMTAEDVAFSYNNANAATNPESRNPRARVFADLIDEVLPVDTITVDFRLNSFDPTTPLRYMSPYFQGAGVVSRIAFNELGVEGMRDTFVGTGPYAVVEWPPDEILFVQALDDHWRRVPSVGEIKVFNVPEAATRMAILLSGESQIVTGLPARDMADLEAQGFKVERGNGRGDQQSIVFSGNYWEKTHPITGVRLDRPQEDRPWIGIFDDPESLERARKVRWALAVAIDRQAINEDILAGMGEVCFLNQTSVRQPGWQGGWEIPYDPDKSRSLLEQAGYRDGFEIPLFVRSIGSNPEIAEAVASMWEIELNVATVLDFRPYAEFRPGLVARTTTTPWVSPGRSGFPIHWPKGRRGSAITDGRWGPGFEDPTHTNNYFKMLSQIDSAMRTETAEDYFAHVHEVMLQPCIVGNSLPSHVQPGCHRRMVPLSQHGIRPGRHEQLREHRSGQIRAGVLGEYWRNVKRRRRSRTAAQPLPGFRPDQPRGSPLRKDLGGPGRRRD